MTDNAVHGLSCPRCGGMVQVPEGQAIVACPYCDQRSVVAVSAAAPQTPAEAGEVTDLAPAVAAPAPVQVSAGVRSRSTGVRRYQAPVRVDADAAVRQLQQFLSGKFQVARDCARLSKVSEVFLVHLPFWAVWGRGVAYAFGQVQVGSGDNKRWEPREKKAVRELTWNVPACEVGEFGVRQVPLEGCPLEPFNPDVLHRSGMVFEPVGSAENALEAARATFEKTIRGQVSMGRTSQVFTRLVRSRLGLVYYPLWVIRYHYRSRAFQIVVDGYNGQVLYGKAPGSVGYRAAVLVGGMAAGAVLAIDVPAAALAATAGTDEDFPLVIALGAFAIGIGLMFGAYRTFRYGEHYEYHRFGKPKTGGEGMITQMAGAAGLPDSLTRELTSIQEFRNLLERKQ